MAKEELFTLQSSPFLRIGSRGSKLALVQAHLVRRLLAAQHGVSEDSIEIRTITTSGDVLTDAPLSQFGGKGLFSKEIEAALAANEIDLGVHSSKDMATTLPEGLVLAAFLKREDVRDAFVSLTAKSVEELPQGAKLGSSSLRRSAQMLSVRPDLQIVPLRGNVDTRLKKLSDGVADATLLAVAGLNRLGRSSEITTALDPALFPPAPAQGAIGLEIRESDTRTRELIAPLNDAESFATVTAERALLRELDGSCRTAIGAYTTVSAHGLHLRAAIYSPDGTIVHRAVLNGPVGGAGTLGREIGQFLRDKAGSEFFKLFPA